MPVRFTRDRPRVTPQQRREDFRRRAPDAVPFVASELLQPRTQRLFYIQFEAMGAMNENGPRRDPVHRTRGAEAMRLIDVDDVVLLPL